MCTPNACSHLFWIPGHDSDVYCLHPCREAGCDPRVRILKHPAIFQMRKGAALSTDEYSIPSYTWNGRVEAGTKGGHRVDLQREGGMPSLFAASRYGTGDGLCSLTSSAHMKNSKRWCMSACFRRACTTDKGGGIGSVPQPRQISIGKGVARLVTRG